MEIYRLKQAVISFQNDPVVFLNGLTSNDMGAPHNAFLNLHGRIVAAFDQVKISDEELWIVVADSAVEAVAQHLDRYLKLAGVKITVLDLRVYFCLDGHLPPEAGDNVISQKAGCVVISKNDYPSNVSEEEFRLFRLKNHIPLHSIDYTDEMILNVGYEDVSFTKGCYLGQEFVSKVHSRSKPTWKLVVKSEAECSPEERTKMTSRTLDPQTGKVSGFVFVKNE